LQPVDPATIRINPTPQAGVILLELQAPAGFVDLLIELQWPRGRMQREVGLLLGTSTSNLVPRVGVPTRVLVQAGDSASQLVAGHLADAGSLSQGLVALQQANPDAFIGGNVNRLRAGAVLKVPTRDEVLAVDPQLASELVALQMEEYAMYREELATQSGSAGAGSEQVATGKVQTPQRDKPETPADRLTLSAPDADGQSDRVARQLQAQKAAERAAELNRNIQELNRLAQSEGGGLPLPATDVPSSELIERLTDHPATPWAALGLVLVLVCGVLWRSLRRAPEVDSEFQPERLVTPLRVDFDLNLPREEDLPPLPPEVLQSPTPATRLRSDADKSSSDYSLGADPIAGLSLDLPDPGGMLSAPLEVPTDPWDLRLALAQALWARGLSQTALVLAREVASQAPQAQAQSARDWLNERA
jgi:FimV-like protein